MTHHVTHLGHLPDQWPRRVPGLGARVPAHVSEAATAMLGGAHTAATTTSGLPRSHRLKHHGVDEGRVGLMALAALLLSGQLCANEAVQVSQELGMVL